MDRCLNSPSDPNHRRHQIRAECIIELPDVLDVTTGDDERVSLRSRLQWKERDPRARLAGDQNRAVLAPSARAEVASFDGSSIRRSHVPAAFAASSTQEPRL